MKISVVTMNDFGNNQFIMSLTKRLHEKGHEVSLCSSSRYSDMANELGIKHYKLMIDVVDIVLRLDELGEFEYMNRRKFDIYDYVYKNMKMKYRQFMDFLFMAVSRADLIVYDTNSIGVTDIAEFLTIPVVHIADLPNIYPLSQYPSDDWNKKSPLRWLFNKRTYKKVSKKDKAIIEVINDFRKEVLEMPIRDAGENFYNIKGFEIPVVYPFSKALFEGVKGLNKNVNITGYAQKSEPDKYTKEIYSFLNSGNPPFLVIFGVIPLEDTQLLLEKVFKAMIASNRDVRYIFALSDTAMILPNHDNFLFVRNTQIKGLASRCTGVVHVGEIENINEAFYYGKTQLIIPLTVKQKIMANFLYSRGMALKAIDERDVTSKDLIDVYDDFNDEKVLSNIKKISDYMQEEDGIECAVEIIESTFKNWNVWFKKVYMHK